MKKPRNKKYQGPKYVARNPAVTFFGGMSDQHVESLHSTLIKNHQAMAAIAQGRGDPEAWNRVNGAINMALVFCEQGIGNEYVEEFKDARDVMLACVLRAKKTQRYLFTGDELQTMNAAMSSHDAQVTCCRYIDVARAAEEVCRRLSHRINVASAHD